MTTDVRPQPPGLDLAAERGQKAERIVPLAIVMTDAERYAHRGGAHRAVAARPPVAAGSGKEAVTPKRERRRGRFVPFLAVGLVAAAVTNITMQMLTLVGRVPAMDLVTLYVGRVVDAPLSVAWMWSPFLLLALASGLMAKGERRTAAAIAFAFGILVLGTGYTAAFMTSRVLLESGSASGAKLMVGMLPAMSLPVLLAWSIVARLYVGHVGSAAWEGYIAQSSKRASKARRGRR